MQFFENTLNSLFESSAREVYKLSKAVAFEGGDYQKLLRISRQSTDRVRERVAKSFYKLATKPKYDSLPLPTECLALLVALSNSDHKETIFFATGAVCIYTAKPVNAQHFINADLPAMLTHLLGRDDEWGKRHAAAALANLASQPEARQALYDAGVVDSVMNALHNDKNEDPPFTHALLTLVANQSPHEASALALVREGCTQCLLDAFDNMQLTSLIREEAARGLCSFASHVQVRPAMVEEGVVDSAWRMAERAGIPALHRMCEALLLIADHAATKPILADAPCLPFLVKMLRLRDNALTTTVMDLLHLLSTDPQGLKRVCWSGAVESLVALADTKDPDVACACAGFLYQLCGDEAVKEHAMEWGIADLIASYIVLDHVQTLRFITGSLFQLTELKSNRENLLDKFLLQIVHLCGTNGDDDIMRYSFGTLLNFSQHDGNRMTLIRGGALDVVLSACHYRFPPAPQYYAVGALFFLLKPLPLTMLAAQPDLMQLMADCYAHVVRENLMGWLADLVRTALDGTKAYAFACVEAMASDRVLNRAIRESELIVLAVEALRKDVTAVVQYSVRAMAALAEMDDGEAVKKIIGAGAIAPLAALLGHDDVHIKISSARTLYLLSFNLDDSATPFVQAGVIPQLAEIVARPGSRQQERFALMLLGRLSHSQQVRDFIRGWGSSRFFVDLYKFVPDAIKAIAISVLAGLSLDVDCADEIVDGLAVDTLLQMTQWKDDNAACEALRTLMNVAAANESNQIELVDAGTIEVVMPLTAHSSQMRSTLAIGVLVKLCQHERHQQLIMSNTNLPSFLRGAIGATDIEVHRVVAETIAALAAFPGNRHNLITAGCLPPLMVFAMANDDARVRRATAKAILAFSIELEHRKRLESGGMVECLGVLLASKDENVLTLTCRILTQLSDHIPFRKHMAPLKVVPLLLNLIKGTHRGLRFDAAMALIHLAYEDAIRTEVVMNGGSRIARAVFNVKQLQQEARHTANVTVPSATVEKKIWRQVVDELMEELEHDPDALTRS
eukprot:TRINITY_DN5239_c0_g2_i1.p1 TRINITY_DN5239_c0_g2~~TRINITY_DN5239_c0_g2_i1.p1  ORF type:complete len:1020 (+),score=229.15 TRINITY_DN5239_c0_g2_i1:120-3179(+)